MHQSSFVGTSIKTNDLDLLFTYRTRSMVINRAVMTAPEDTPPAIVPV